MLWKIEGRTIRDLMLMPVSEVRRFFETLALPAPLDEATDLLLGEIRTRLSYLGEVGLGYLTLDRQSRTLSGGEVQRINLTTALGTSLVNTLFVLDEPSIGLHPRDMGRVIGVDYGLVIPDEAKTLREGAIKPWQTPSFKECQGDLAKYLKKHGVPMDLPWREMKPEHRAWVLEGDADWVSWKKSWPGKWYGVGRFFK